LKIHPVFCAAPHSLRLYRSEADTDVLWMTKVVTTQTYAKELS